MHNKIGICKRPFSDLRIEQKPNVQHPFFPTGKSIKD